MRTRLLRTTRSVPAALCLTLLLAGAALALGQSFSSLPADFAQSLYAVSSANLGGIAWAPNGDGWVDESAFAGSALHRFDSRDTLQQHDSSVHIESVAASNAGCGLANHPDGTLYSNASIGVTNLDANSAALLRSLGVPGNALGIAVDPRTNHLVYVAADCRFTATCSLIGLDPVTGASTAIAHLTASDAQLVDGIAFDPSGSFLFLANRSPLFRLTVLTRDGRLVQHIRLTSEPDGVAVHGTSPAFVVTNNTDGTLTRLEFPNADYTAAPAVSTFAAGGFRGDLAGVGQDGCLYVTQAGVRFDDGTTSGQSSAVRICGPSDFSRPTGVPTVTQSVTPSVTPSATVTQTVTPSVTPTATVTQTVTPSVTPSATVTPTVTPSVTPTLTLNPASLRSLSLGGKTAFAEAAASPDLNLTSDWTVQLWLRDRDASGFDHDYRYLLNKGDGVQPESPYYVLLGNGSVLVGLRTAGTNYPLTYNLHPAGYSAKIWQHVAATFQSSTTTLTLYLDGAAVSRQVMGVRSLGNSLPLEVGRGGPITAKYWVGNIDDIRVWNRVLTSAEVLAGFRHELDSTQPPPAGLVANWKFDAECSGLGQDSVGGHTLALFGPGIGWSADIPSAPNTPGAATCS